MWILARSGDKDAPTIARELGINKGRVYRIQKRGHPTPTKPKGAKLKLSESQMDDVIAFITASEENRRMPYPQVCQTLNLPVAKDALKRALQNRGYYRERSTQGFRVTADDAKAKTGKPTRDALKRKKMTELTRTRGKICGSTRLFRVHTYIERVTRHRLGYRLVWPQEC